MKNKKFSRFENLYFFAVFAFAFIYLYSVQENGIIDFGEQFYQLMFLGFLFFIGFVLTTIKYTAKEGKVNKKAVIITIAFFLLFVLLRVLLSVV
ncbi:hypothetical protein J7E38_16905 [Bacillus sp. ISL-35]|uniref:hypothetical protein n=1 Tax=Bacillus sp. ISL-35 TaxID=2819122 RepID=UPI001BE54F09|nr:hypothetical protein [Bacillus sp. ISL-35]MBT2680692.1 hypothetical protein [Bacillus sp. ISL-35]MBT2702677.1 hypothetical protein [Chryseobacterium sp. ISL-80]